MAIKHTKTHVVSTPTYHADLEQVAAELNEICKDRLCDGRIPGGILAGREPEIRQDALSRLLGGFLLGSNQYQLAVSSRCPRRIQEAMNRCAAIAMSYAKRDMNRGLANQHHREAELQERDGGACHHPSGDDPAVWSVGAKVELLRRCLAHAVQTGRLTPLNASLALRVCDRGVPVQQVAQEAGISPNAVYQHLWKVREVVSDLKDKIDLWC